MLRTILPDVARKVEKKKDIGDGETLVGAVLLIGDLSTRIPSPDRLQVEADFALSSCRFSRRREGLPIARQRDIHFSVAQNPSFLRRTRPPRPPPSLLLAPALARSTAAAALALWPSHDLHGLPGRHRHDPNRLRLPLRGEQGGPHQGRVRRQQVRGHRQLGRRG